MYCISISLGTCFPFNFCWKKLSQLKNLKQKDKRKITPVSDVSNRLPIYTVGNGDNDPDPEKQESPRPSHPAPVAWGIPSFQRNPKVVPQGENDRNDFCGLPALLCFTPQDLEDYTFV
ncbi:uncharacterized protein ACOB8E_017753 [Sarcophilus harrisii]